MLRLTSGLQRKPWKIAALVLLAALFATDVYRAATQSVSHDEGVMFGWFLSGDWRQVIDFAHGNHHVVSDLLCKLSIELFGLSPLTMRIPALIGAVLYSWAVYGISALLFGEGLLFLLSVAVLSLNPLVLDYLTLARGYGLALGLFFFALYQATRYVVEDRAPRWSLLAGGVALGLAVGSNPIMVFPGAALAACTIAILLANAVRRGPEPVPVGAPVGERTRKGKKTRRREEAVDRTAAAATRSWTRALVQFVLVAVVIGGFFLLLPKQLIELEQGYMGPESVTAILEGLVRYSILHSPSGFAGLLAMAPPEPVVRFLTSFVIPLLFAGVVAAGVVAGIRWWREQRLEAVTPVERALLLLAPMLPLILALVVVSRYLFGKPYPELRTAMYWIPLLSLASLCLAGRLMNASGNLRFLAVPLTGALALGVVQYATQFNTRYFAEWAYCAAGKEMMQAIRDDRGDQSGGRVRVGLSWQLEPVVNFYRVAWGLPWMDPVYRETPDAVYDYYLLMNHDRPILERRRLKIMMDDRLSGVVLAKRMEPGTDAR